MIRGFREQSPIIPDSAWVAESALVMGQVTLGEHVGVFPGAVIRGDFTDITIGAHTIIEDNCVVHSGESLTLGEHVIVGHGAVVHCRSIGNNSLIANNATVLDGAVIGNFCVIGAGCVVSPNAVIPDESLVFGVPHTIAGKVKENQMARLKRGNASYIEMFRAYREAGI